MTIDDPLKPASVASDGEAAVHPLVRKKHGQAFQREVGVVVEHDIECRLAVFQAAAVHVQGQELILPWMVEQAQKQQGSIVVRQGGRCGAGCEVDGQVRGGRANELDVGWS